MLDQEEMLLSIWKGMYYLHSFNPNNLIFVSFINEIILYYIEKLNSLIFIWPRFHEINLFVKLEKI